ncbi:MAG: hypothetical protein JWQ68_970 [Cryobacterium sp.]|nr:hypothetical protein [Cryobacterium sp.]
MITHLSTSHSIYDVDLEPVSPTEWAVWELHSPPGDTVIGLIHCLRDRFEVTELADPVRFLHFSTFQEAVDSFATMNPRSRAAAAPAAGRPPLAIVE